MKSANRNLAVSLSTWLALASPGLFPYKAAAQMLELPAEPLSLQLEQPPVAAEAPAVEAPSPAEAAAAAPALADLTVLKPLDLTADTDVAGIRQNLASNGSDASLRSAAGKAFDRASAPALSADEDVDPPSPDVFKALNAGQKALFTANYLAHLHKRDGQPDWSDPNNPRFEVREKVFRDIEANPVRRTGPAVVDQKTFSDNEATHHPAKNLDHKTLWALAMAKGNRLEYYGVMKGLKDTFDRMKGPDDPMRYIGVEEFYHTRVLRDALEVLGLKMRLLPPHPVTAWMLRRIVGLPKFLSNVLIMCAEVAGVAVFRLLADKAKELFPDQEEPQRRIQELMQQILVDEVGHVHYVRSQLGPVRLFIARMMMPFFVPAFISDVPELPRLFGWRKLMKAILAADVDGASAHYSDRLEPYRRPAK